MPQHGLDLLVVIVSWNTRELLLACLSSALADAATLGSESVQVCVVDNASTDGSVEAVRAAFPAVAVLENGRNAGFAAANNRALRYWPASAYMLLNSDTVVGAGAFRRLLDLLDEHPKAGACGARLLNGDGSLQASAYPMLTPDREFWRLSFLDRLVRRGSYPMHRWPLDEPRQVEVLTGACLLIRGVALDHIGLLDETYFMYTEEVDLCYRLEQAGWEMWWEPRAVVTHYGGASSKQAQADMYVQLYRSKMQFFRKFGGEREAHRYLHLLAAAYWPRLLLSSLGCSLDPTWREQADIYRRLLRALPTLSSQQ